MDLKKININQSESSYYIASDIYDVSTRNNGATFESIQTLLSSDNLSTLIPTTVRCGGMTIRFIQSLDNKYVQYRLTSTSFSTTESDWQDVTLQDKLNELVETVNRNLIVTDEINIHIGRYLKSDNSLEVFPNSAYTDYFLVKPGETLLYTGAMWGSGNATMVFLDKEGSIISFIPPITNHYNGSATEVVDKEILVPEGVYKARACRAGNITEVYSGILSVKIKGKNIEDGGTSLILSTENKTKIEENKTKIEELDNRTTFFEGEDIILGNSSAVLNNASGNYVVPYIIDENYSYLLKSVEFPQSDLDFTSGIDLKLCLFDTERSDGEISKLTVSKIYDLKAFNKTIEVNVKFNGNQLCGIFVNPSLVPNLFGYKYGAGYYSFILNNVPTVGKEYTDKLENFKIDLSIVFNILKITKTTFVNKKLEKLENKISYNAKTLSYQNSDAVLLEGSSLTETLYNPYGTGWVERINDMIDIPLINNGYGGKSRAYNITQIANNLAMKLGNGIKANDFRASHVMWLNSANGSKKGKEGYAELNVAKYITEQIGAKMLLGSEEFWYEGGSDELYTSYGTSNGIPYSLIRTISKKCYPVGSGNYAGLKGNSHGGWRVTSTYIIHKDLLGNLPILKAIKLYRVRPKFVVSTINDLAYDNNEERLYKFIGISSGVGHQQKDGRNIDFRSADNLDDNGNQYDISNSDTLDGNNLSEVAMLLAGRNIEFDKYALIECVLDANRLSYFSFSCYCSVQPTKVYVAKFILGSINESSIKSPYTTFEELKFTYTDNNLSFDISEVDGILLYDKVRIIVEGASQFSISKPICTYNGSDKEAGKLNFPQRKFGEKMFNDTGFVNSNWTLYENAKVVSFPTGTEQYTSYNNNKYILWLPDNVSYAERVIQTSGAKKIAVRVIAQNYYKLMTTRFSGEEYNDFVESNATLLGLHEYDYGKLVLTLNDKYVKEFTVMPGWAELYAEFDLQEDTSLNVKLQRDNKNGIYTSESTPILVHDVSIEIVE